MDCEEDDRGTPSPMLQCFYCSRMHTMTHILNVLDAGTTEAEAHFSVGLATGGVVGVAEVAGHIDHLLVQGGLEELAF